MVLKSKPLATTNNTRNQLFAIPFFTNTHIGSPRQPQAIGNVILIHFPAKHALLATGTSLNGVVARTNSIAPYCDWATACLNNDARLQSKLFFHLMHNWASCIEIGSFCISGRPILWLLAWSYMFAIRFLSFVCVFRRSASHKRAETSIQC